MPPLSRATSGFASMIMSDSEPDFDDVEAVKVPPSRRTDKKLSTSKGNNKRECNNANRVTKSAQRHELSYNGGKNVSHPAIGRQIATEKTKNRVSTGVNGNHEHSEQPDGHNSDSQTAKEGRNQHNSKRPHETKDKSDHQRERACLLDGNMAHGQNMQLTDMDEHSDAAKISKPTLLYDVDEFAARNESGYLREKYDALEARHIQLRDVGVKAAECNFERLKKQSKETTAASTILISELKAELAIQSGMVRQNEQTGRELERSQGIIGELEKTIADLTASLSQARSEIQSLSAKLSASRAVEAGAKIPTSMIKAGTGGAKSTTSGAVLAAQAKEDLYGDLTGLIVRGTSQTNGENVFDCIQTGRNGTLHFKLALEPGDDPDKYDEIQFTYRPQIDGERDRDLVTVLPDYLVDEIAFTRTHASNFYSRLNRALTERLD